MRSRSHLDQARRRRRTRPQGRGHGSTRPARPHKTIDWVKFTNQNGDPCPTTGDLRLRECRHLKVCIAGDDHVRPTEFERPPATGSAPSTVVLKREKAPEDDRCAACDEPKDKAKDAPKGDLGKLQGTWTAKAGPEKNVPIVVTIKGNAVTLKITTPDGVDYSADGEVKIDETAKPHKTIDWVEVHQPQRRAPCPRTSAFTSSSTPTPCGSVAAAPATSGRPSSRPARAARPTCSS